MEHKKAIIFIGPPGAGKGTQAELLVKEFGYYHIETAKLIENKFKTAKPDDPDYDVVQQAEKDFNDGKIVDPFFTNNLVTEEFRKASAEQKSIILSSSPRSVFEAREGLPTLIEEYGKENVYVIHMPIREETSIARNSKRRICEANRHPIPFLPETENWTICPEDGSRLVTRGILDDPETIKKRLVEYKERTEPILDLIKNDFGLEVHFVDGEKPILERYKDIKKIISGNN